MVLKRDQNDLSRVITGSGAGRDRRPHVVFEPAPEVDDEPHERQRGRPGDPERDSHSEIRPGRVQRLHEDAGRWSATLAQRVSCPACDEVVTLPDDVKPGDTVRCCGRTYRLTFEYGAFAAEET